MEKKKIKLTIVFLAGLLSLTLYLYSGNDALEPAPPVVTAPQPEPEIITPAPEPKESPAVVPEPENKKIIAEKIKPPVAPAQVMAPPVDDAELEYEQNQFFETLVRESFPVHTIQAHNPLNPEAPGPPEGEVWLRIKPENAREMNEIMAEVADLYRDIAGQADEDIVVMHWVGAQPYARHTYSPDGTIN